MRAQDRRVLARRCQAGSAASLVARSRPMQARWGRPIARNRAGGHSCWATSAKTPMGGGWEGHGTGMGGAWDGN
eukprot:2530297-Alexandrium_andersonii.AAC.1